jgi:hypothetical protein
MSETIPLTHFEELMLHQDSSAYPVSCFVRLRFEGRLVRAAFESAACVAIGSHPLLHAVVEKQKRYVWRVGDVAPKITWTDGDHQPEPEMRQLDITAEYGLRFFVRLYENRSDVLIQLHHACCDGIAIYQVVRDLMIAYAAELSDGAAIKFPSIDDSLLRDRESTGRKFGALMKLLFHQAARLPHAFNFFARTPAQLVPHQPQEYEGEAPSNFPALIAHHFDTTTSAAIRDSLKTGVTVNDVLMRDLFLAIRGFRRTQGIENNLSWLRLMIPTSLRRASQFRASAANMIGAVFLDRRGLGMSDPELLLDGIQREMNQIKRLELGHLFSFALRPQRLVPGALRRAARPGRCCVTAVFTNIGRVLERCPLPCIDGRWQAGNVVLLATEVAAPIARNVCASFGVTSYAGRLSLSLHYDARVLSPSAAKTLLSMFARKVETSAGVRTNETLESVELI